MSLVIDLTPSEEARISAAAKQTGLAPSEWVNQEKSIELKSLNESLDTATATVKLLFHNNSNDAFSGTSCMISQCSTILPFRPEKYP